MTSTAASAPSSASIADAAMSTFGRSSLAAPSATGSKATTEAPSPSRREASTRLEASRMSSVSGLKASPSSATRLPTSESRCFESFDITRRFCSSFTSITELSSWKW